MVALTWWLQLHHVGRFPHGLIAPITYMWRPVFSGPRGKRQMWVWVHAAAFEEASSCLLAACQKLVSVFCLPQTLLSISTRGIVED